MSDTRPVTDYFQLDRDGKNNAVTPADDKQLVDLDEYYATTEQATANERVAGAENYVSTGKLSRRTAMIYGLTDARHYEPFESAANGRRGTESFFTAVKNGLEHFITQIIKYIKMAVDWVTNNLKALFGVTRSAARTVEAVNALDHLKKEMFLVYHELGILDYAPGGFEYFNFVDKVQKNGEGGQQAILILKNKAQSDVEALQGIVAAAGERETALRSIFSLSVKATTAADKMSEKLTNITKQLGTSKISAAVANIETKRIITDAKAAFDYDTLLELTKQLLKKNYDYTFDNETLNKDFSKVRESLNSAMMTSEVKIGRANFNELEMHAVLLNQNLQQVKTFEAKNGAQMVKINGLAELVRKEDLNMIQTIANASGDQTLVVMYQSYAGISRNFVDMANLVVSTLKNLESQIINVSKAYTRMYVYYSSIILDDIETFKKMEAEARANGEPPLSIGKAGYVKYSANLSVLNPQTLHDKLGENVRDIIEKDAFNLKKAKKALDASYKTIK